MCGTVKPSISSLTAHASGQERQTRIIRHCESQSTAVSEATRYAASDDVGRSRTERNFAAVVASSSNIRCS